MHNLVELLVFIFKNSVKLFQYIVNIITHLHSLCHFRSAYEESVFLYFLDELHARRIDIVHHKIARLADRARLHITVKPYFFFKRSIWRVAKRVRRFMQMS